MNGTALVISIVVDTWTAWDGVRIYPHPTDPSGSPSPFLSYPKKIESTAPIHDHVE
jgi:hypothetical protein